MDSAKCSTLQFKYKLARFGLLLRKAYPFLGEVCMRVGKYKKDNLSAPAAVVNWLIMSKEWKLRYNNLPVIPISGSCYSAESSSLKWFIFRGAILMGCCYRK